VAAAGLELFVAGAGPAYSDRPGSLGSSYVVRRVGDDREADAAVVLDLGQGTFPNLFRVTRPEAVSAVLLSHLHPDHWVDLVPFRHYLQWELDARSTVRVVAPAGLDGRLDAVSGESDFCGTILAVEELHAGPVEMGAAGLEVEAGRVRHRGEAYAFRIAPVTGGRALVYSGDCGRTADLEPLIRPGDVLLSEVSFGTGPSPAEDMHLDAAAVGDLAARCAVGRVLLTHLQMGFDREATVAMVRAAYDGPVELVEPGDIFDLRGGVRD
jgi:ribonuclease BN (tRNA processing enzyme)